MREIGVREFKAKLSGTLQSVAAGEPLRVTSHGRPLVDVIPAGPTPGDARYHALVAAGRLTPPVRPLPPRPPRLARVSRNASEEVLSERDAER